MPEVVETGTKHACQRGKRANVATQVTAVRWVELVCLDHHGHGIPAHVGSQSLLNKEVARRSLLLGRLDGVDVAGGGRKRHVDAALPGVFEQLLEQEMGPLGAFLFDHGGQCVHPLSRFMGICVLCSDRIGADLLFGLC